MNSTCKTKQENLAMAWDLDLACELKAIDLEVNGPHTLIYLSRSYLGNALSPETQEGLADIIMQFLITGEDKVSFLLMGEACEALDPNHPCKAQWKKAKTLNIPVYYCPLNAPIEGDHMDEGPILISSREASDRLLKSHVISVC